MYTNPNVLKAIVLDCEWEMYCFYKVVYVKKIKEYRRFRKNLLNYSWHRIQEQQFNLKQLLHI